MTGAVDAAVELQSTGKSLSEDLRARALDCESVASELQSLLMRHQGSSQASTALAAALDAAAMAHQAATDALQAANIAAEQVDQAVSSLVG